MTTNFALSLSSDSIRLLHRVADGWHLVSETELDVPDLGGALTQMREDALALEPGGLRTKVLIPTSQIKFVTLETAQTSLDDVMAALEGATPYATSDLVVDFDRNGGRTFIAAVARETLDEAEGFAKQYDFAPVSFAAVPNPMTFGSEVFFGPTSIAATLTDTPITRDAQPVVVPGTATMPAAPLAPEDVPVFAPRPSETPAVTPKISRTPTPEVAPPVVAAPQVTAPVAPEDQPAAEIAAFASTRSAGAAPPKEPAAKKPSRADRKAEKAAAFATKQAQPVRGKPKFLGLILTAILILLMALVALWASTLSEEDVANWFGFGTGGIVETAEIPPPDIVPATAPIDTATVAPEVAEESALPQLRETVLGRVLSPAEAARIYAATGVWQRAPRLPLKPTTSALTVNRPRFARSAASAPQPALPQVVDQLPDLTFLAPINPPAFGSDFARDADGFILATPEGTVTPQGAFVIAGAPPRKPPLRQPIIAEPVVPEALPDAPDGVVVIAGRPTKTPPVRPAFAPREPAVETPAPLPEIAGFRPKLRPASLAPVAPTAPELTVAEAGKRPKSRPASLAPAPVPEAPTPDITDVVAAIAAAVPESPFVTPTARAVAASSRPDTRPRNFASVVSRARDQAAQQAARAASAQPAVRASSQPARPSGNTPGSVAKAATLDNAIRLRDVNLIGVYGRPNNRRALVRLGNGRYLKVEIGSRLDGGRVTAIGDSALNYVKRGKTIALQLPSG